MLVSLMYQAIAVNFPTKQTESLYVRNLGLLLSEDNLEVMKTFEGIERKYTALIAQCNKFEDYVKVI